MLRGMLEILAGKMNDRQFRRVSEMATDDIRVNRLGFKKMTYLADVMEIASRCVEADQRKEKDGHVQPPKKNLQSHYIRKEWDKSIKIDDLVLAREEAYGSYVCQVENVFKDGFIEASVLAVIEYPSQRAIFWPENIAPRKPYSFNFHKRFFDYEPYFGPTPDYRESLVNALDTAIARARKRGDTAELKVLENHWNELNPRAIA